MFMWENIINSKTSIRKRRDENKIGWTIEIYFKTQSLRCKNTVIFTIGVSEFRTRNTVSHVSNICQANLSVYMYNHNEYLHRFI